MTEGLILSAYLNRIAETANHGDAREETYYSTLSDLLDAYITLTNRRNVIVAAFPKNTDGGNPDFRIWDGRQHIVGYIEAKAPNVEDLNKVEGTEQLRRYRDVFANLILTNFLEFRLYRGGELIDKVTIGRPLVLNKLKMAPPVENETELLNLLDRFFSFSLPKVYDARSLAVELAKRTRFLKDVIISHEFSNNVKSSAGNIAGFYEAFNTYLIGSLTKEEFANLYAQTVTYGLFAARMRCNDGFRRLIAFDSVPKTLGVLRDVFRFISSSDLPRHMEWIIDDISEVLAVTDVNAILHQYFHDDKGDDPVVHFYETFLSVYDPETREKRGVYYTPEPVVSYIVRSLNIILKDKFAMPYGLASDSVTLLDPAAGTFTFLTEASKLAIEEYTASYGSGDKSGFIRRHILQNFYGFELMMAPYAIGHIKMSFVLEEMGYTLQDDERVRVFITNTLDMEELEQSRLPGMSSLSEESHKAGDVKNKTQILVILGNPPYSVSSANKSVFIESEMGVYKLGVAQERNIQPLSDDYIKFIRFAQWKIDRHGRGLIGMITNNSYLSGLIHRGMRKSLLGSFNQIYVLNLHGSSRIGERAPDGGKDDNVFDIQQGVSIVFLVKKNKFNGIGKLYYQDVFGLRENKYDCLNKNDVSTTQWIELKPSEPYYFFVEKDFSLQADYEVFTPIPEIFEKYSSGVTTHRDHLVIGFNQEEIRQRMITFTGNLPDDLVAQALNLNGTNDWNIKTARERLKNVEWMNYIKPYSYRPFDTRLICYLPELIDRDRWEIMQNFIEEGNMGLMISRQVIEDFRHAFISCNIVNYNYIDVAGRFGTGSFFPLYVYPAKNKRELFSNPDGSQRRINISIIVSKSLSKTYKKEPSPEEIFYYIYAVLYSNTYRAKYAEFLKIDFPRIPFTKDYDMFIRYVHYGKRLVEMHLLKSPELDPPIARYQGRGDNRVVRLQYDDKVSHLHINDAQYFEGIIRDVWEYQIGGYQVCQKWLKDRKTRLLSFDEIKCYCKIVTALQKTIEIQAEIDMIYNKLENDIIIRLNKI
ncbi:MAG: N-6 DNA methylase [Nitrospirae bacterium]|nr:N-6 DNA methylase [Nitrospirota bacterium]